jgi:hypothetical protein
VRLSKVAAVQRRGRRQLGVLLQLRALMRAA